jgi:hypothetical protein
VIRLLPLLLVACLRPDGAGVRIVTEVRAEHSCCGGTYLVVTDCDRDGRNCHTWPTDIRQ